MTGEGAPDRHDEIPKWDDARVVRECARPGPRRLQITARDDGSLELRDTSGELDPVRAVSRRR